MFKSYKSFIMVIICILITFNLFDVFAASSDTTHIDAILVVDTSNSMNGSDPRKIAIDGIKLFVDMMETSGSRVGVIGFNDSITFKTELTEINSFQDKQDFINDIGRINYTGYTDIGMALKEAERMLFSKVDKGNKPMIVLFTDGYIETRGTGRTDQKSRDEVDEVILGAKNNYPIYTIGLNRSGRVDQDLIEKIAKDTNALSYMTNQAEDLPEIFNAIFADYIKSNIINVGTITTDGLNYSDININIPNDSVLEANIIMLSNNTNAVLDTRLTNPDGIEQVIGSNSIYLSSQGAYSVIKIIQPKKGDWKLSVKGIAGDQIKINLLYNYDISLQAQMQPSSQLKKNQDITVIGKLFANNQPLNDSELMKDFNAELKVKDENGNLIETIPMDNTSTEFSVYYKIPDTGTKFDLQVDAAGSGFFRQSNILEIEITNSPPRALKQIENRSFFNIPFLRNSISIDLNEYFEDEDNPTLNFSAVSSNDSIKANIDNGILKIHTDKFLLPVSSTINLEISDLQSEPISASFEVFTFPILIIIIFILILIIIIIVIIKLHKNKKANSRLLTGYFEYRFTLDGIWQAQQQEPLYNYRGIVNLNNIIKASDKYNMTELSLITVQAIIKEGQKILVFENKSSYECTANFTTANHLELKYNETINIVNNLDNSELQITYLEDLFI